MYSSNQSSEVDEVYLHDISLKENYIFNAKTCIDYDHFDPDLPVSNNANKRKDRSMHSNPSQRPCNIIDCHQEKGPADITENLKVYNKKKQEEIVHVRAKRGQATNSHSLAERVRREKIGERMRHLQDLVPGCNKIIGKAMMLDEIINYVQSLQRQIEFLSMKLAAIYPEENGDLEQILTRDMVFPPKFTTSCLGLVPNSSNTNSNLYGLTPQGLATSSKMAQIEIPSSATTPQILGLSDFDLQNMFQTGFVQPVTIANSDSIEMDSCNSGALINYTKL